MGILSVELEALLVTVRCAPTHVLAAGAKVTLTLMLCPAATTTGKVAPEIWKTGLVAPMAEIVAGVLPEFVKKKTWVSVWPTCTLRKFSDDGVSTSCAVVLAQAGTIKARTVKKTHVERDWDLRWGSRMTSVCPHSSRST